MRDFDKEALNDLKAWCQKYGAEIRLSHIYEKQIPLLEIVLDDGKEFTKYHCATFYATRSLVFKEVTEII